MSQPSPRQVIKIGSLSSGLLDERTNVTNLRGCRCGSPNGGVMGATSGDGADAPARGLEPAQLVCLCRLGQGQDLRHPGPDPSRCEKPESLSKL